MAPTSPEPSHSPLQPAASDAAPPAPVAWMHTRAARAVYWAMLAVAILALKEAIHALRALAGDPAVRIIVWIALPLELAWLAVLGVSTATLALFVYEDLRGKGRLGRRRPFFERLLSLGDQTGP